MSLRFPHSTQAPNHPTTISINKASGGKKEATGPRKFTAWSLFCARATRHVTRRRRRPSSPAALINHGAGRCLAGGGANVQSPFVTEPRPLDFFRDKRTVCCPTNRRFWKKKGNGKIRVAVERGLVWLSDRLLYALLLYTEWGRSYVHETNSDKTLSVRRWFCITD